jgi:hypothetical protein
MFSSTSLFLSFPLSPFSFPFFSPSPFYPSPFTFPLPLSLKEVFTLEKISAHDDVIKFLL